MSEYSIALSAAGGQEFEQLVDAVVNGGICRRRTGPSVRD